MKIFKVLLVITFFAYASNSYANYLTDFFKLIFIDGIPVSTEYEGAGRKIGIVHYNNNKGSLAARLKKENKSQGIKNINISELRLPFYKRNNRIFGLYTTYDNDHFHIISNWISHRFIPGDIIIAGLLCAGVFVAYKKWSQK